MLKNTLYAGMIATTLIILPQTAMAEPGARGRERHQPFLTRDRTQVDLTLGLRQDNLRWNVSATENINTTPNILSELTWENVQHLEMQVKGRHISPTSSRIFRGGWQLEGEVRGGLGVGGEVQDSDYLGNDRTQEFSRITADSDTGFTLGAQAAAGYRFNIAQRTKGPGYTFITLAPLVGYGVDYTRFKLEGTEVDPIDPANPLTVDSDFYTTWEGPFVGLEGQWEHNRHMLTMRGEYHDLSYYGRGIWDQRSDLQQAPSFEQDGEGSGKKLMLEYSYAPDSKYEFTVGLSHMERSIDPPGSDTIYRANGVVTTRKRLREVEHETQALRIGMNYGW